MNPELLLYDSSKLCVINAAREINNNRELLEPMLDLGLSGKAKTSSRALRAIAVLAERESSIIIPYIGKIIDSAGNAELESNKFNLLKLLTFIDVPDDEQVLNRIINLCYDAIEAKAERVAIKVYAIEILGKIVGKYPELSSELKLIINKHYEYSTMTFRCRADRIMKKLGRKLEIEN